MIKKLNKNYTKTLFFNKKISKSFVKLCNFLTFILTVRYALQKNFWKELATNKMYITVYSKSYEMIETDVVNGYKISGNFYVNHIYFLESFIVLRKELMGCY